MTACANCAALERQVVDLTEELAEWRARDRSDKAAAEDLARALDMRARLGLRPGIVRLMAHLLRHPGVVQSTERLLQIVAHGDWQDRNDAIVRVALCHLRAALAARVPGTAIQPIYGHGYLLDTPDAVRIREWLGVAA